VVRPDRSVGERLVNEQLEDRQRWVRESGWDAVVIAIGAAAPVKTPLIGPPVSFK
jgi:hypothetical protein